MTEYFERKTFFEFLKLEFKHRKKANTILKDIVLLPELFLSGIFNYITHKDWSIQYQIIKPNLIHLYPELDCNINGVQPRLKTLLKNYNQNRITFTFNKAHIAITKDALFFFPYTTPIQSTYSLSSTFLGEPFRLRLSSKLKLKAYHENQNLNLLSLKQTKDKTIIRIEVDELEDYMEIIVNEVITI